MGSVDTRGKIHYPLFFRRDLASNADVLLGIQGLKRKMKDISKESFQLCAWIEFEFHGMDWQEQKIPAQWTWNGCSVMKMNIFIRI